MQEMTKDLIRCFIDNGQLRMDMTKGPGAGRPMPISGDVSRIIDLTRGERCYQVKFRKNSGEVVEENLLAVVTRSDNVPG